MHLRLRLSAVSIFFVALLSTGCGRHHQLTVGSKNFTEQVILGEILAQEVGTPSMQPVRRQLDLGGTFICHQALLRGDIDAYPEYTGTALTAIFKQPAVADRARALQQVRQQYAKLGLRVSDPLGFNDTFAILVRADDAHRFGLRTISDLAKRSGAMRPGFGYEFMERADGYRGFVQAYGLQFSGAPRIMDLGLLYRALADNQVDLVAGNSTDGRIAAMHMIQLVDDRHYFPAYEAVIVYRSQAATALEPALRPLAGAISDTQMARMNGEVDMEHKSARDVAAEFLKAQKRVR